MSESNSGAEQRRGGAARSVGMLAALGVSVASVAVASLYHRDPPPADPGAVERPTRVRRRFCVRDPFSWPPP